MSNGVQPADLGFFSALAGAGSLSAAARELGITLYRTFVGGKGISVPASKIAKWKTVLQQLAVGFAILPLTALDAKWLWNSLLWASVVFALVSGGQYLWRARSAVPASQLSEV